MIKVLIVASIIFGAVFSFGLTTDKLQVAQMASGLENISNNLFSGLETLGLNEEDQNVGTTAVTQADLDFEFGILKIDPDGTPDTRDERFVNVVTHCNFHSDESIGGETCVACHLYDGTIDEHTDLGSGNVTLPDGYGGSNTIAIEITDVDFEGQNSVLAVDGVVLDVCFNAEACAVGFWQANIWAWNGIPIPTDADFRVTFGIGQSDDFAITFEGEELENPTLLQALNAEGDGINALARESVAALLNSESEFDYPMTSTEVVIGFWGSFTAETFDDVMTQHFAEINNDVCPLINNGIGDAP